MKNKSNWLGVTFNCSNGWDKVHTSIPVSEKENAKTYLEKQKFTDVKDIVFDDEPEDAEERGREPDMDTRFEEAQFRERN